jgi:lysyl-tRNA synthetase, class II
VAELTQAMVTACARTVLGSTIVRHTDGTEHDLGGEWRPGDPARCAFAGSPMPRSPWTPADVLRGFAHKNDVPLEETDWELSAGEIALELFEKLVEHTLVESTNACNYPVEAVR